jgi:hypothetical protein
MYRNSGSGPSHVRPNEANLSPGRSLHVRRNLLIAVGVTALVTSAVSIGGSTLIRSPQQVTAEAGPPKASVISAFVERRLLKDTVVLRGSAVPWKTIDVKVPKLVRESPVVTHVRVHKGETVNAGDVVTEIAGRPILALPGGIPAYRDIQPGDQGPDIEQLQTALNELGYGASRHRGIFDTATQESVKRLYGDRGYKATMWRDSPTSSYL